ncbi:hypothetical protein [Epilithonimonas xixisoli]|uniref:Uncharacterized protein n=1 Tax=Epilithonimonas xixisoli TaxID=1476462 RepID=A0A4R8I456_9FLAO|nr:hypothetical protein [Epilithonimonas xixisoli]TDX83088.1 hypothetical protein B0I22_3151 [Epilithonimonas xixisoli]
MNTFISYEGLPIKSGGAHKLNKKDSKEIYNEISFFLKNFASDVKLNQIEVSLYESKEKTYSTFKLLFKLILKFGLPKYLNDGLLKSWTWNLSQKKFQKGFEILELNNQLPNNPFGPISLNFKWNFHFKNNKTNITFPNQNLIPEIDFRNKNSQIYLRISKKSTISTWFAFPFEEINKFEKEYINELKTNLPFKLSDNHWKIWKKSQNGNWFSRKHRILKNIKLEFVNRIFIFANKQS